MTGDSETRQRYNRYLPGFSAPIQALFFQLVSFFLVFFLLHLLFRFVGWTANTLVFGLLQGGLAAVISHVRGMRRWWLPIQFFFPLAMFLLLAMQVSPAWYLGAFFVLLLLFWGAVVTRVPLYLSGWAAWEAVLNVLPQTRPARVIDVGSGLGGLVLYLAKKRPDCVVEGIEISPFLWGISRIRQKLSKSLAHFMPGNYERLDLGAYDVVFAYLSPLVMDGLWMKAVAEMRPGTMLLSFEFGVEGVEPDIRIAVGNRVLFGWIMGEKTGFQP